MKLIFAFIMFFSVSTSLFAVAYSVDYPRVGVIENSFDDVETYLEKYGISYDYIPYAELENPEIYEKYDIIYYPNGIEREINSSIEILARERGIEGVTFNAAFYRIKDSKIFTLMHDFVYSGKTVICSGYSAKFLEGAFDYFRLYNDFPNLGLYGVSDITPSGRLMNYTRKEVKTVMEYDGYWVAEGIKRGEVLLESAFNTPLGLLKSPAGSLCEYESGGKAYYLSELGKTDKDGIMRFFTVSILYDGYYSKMKRLIDAWDQVPVDYVIDRNFSFDNGREYKLAVKQGHDTIYGFFEKGLFQVDIYDSSKKLIFSKNHVSGKFEKTLNFETDSVIYVKMYSDADDFGGVILFGTGSGKRIVPYFIIIRNVLLLCALLTLVVTIIKRRRRYSGIYPDMNSGEDNG